MKMTEQQIVETARAKATAWLNNNLRKAGKPEVADVSTTWWDNFGADWIARVREQASRTPVVQPDNSGNTKTRPVSRKRRQSRAARWSEAVSKAVDGLQELVDLQEEYQNWLDNLPEGLQSSAVADKLQAVVDMDLQGAMDTVQEAEGADLPLGWGKD